MLGSIVVCLIVDFFLDGCFIGLHVLALRGCVLRLSVRVIVSRVSGPPSLAEGFQVQLLLHRLMYSLTMFSSVHHDACARWVGAIFLGAAAMPSSLLEFQVSVWAMVVGPSMLV